MQRVLIVSAVVVALTSAIFLAVHSAGPRPIAQYDDGAALTGSTSGTSGSTITAGGPVTATPETPAPYFAFRRLEVQTSGDEPEACLVFTRKLDASGATHYEDYLKFDPEAKIAVQIIFVGCNALRRLSEVRS